MFNGVQDSYETAVKPFVQNLVENVSSQLTIVNLGWVVDHEDIRRANRRRMPILLGRDAPMPGVSEKLGKLASQYLAPKTRAAVKLRPDPARYLEAELEVLLHMQEDLKGATYEDNFKYIVSRSLHVMASKRLTDLGDNQIFKRFEFERVLAQRGR
jgi:hypothetical protein